MKSFKKSILLFIVTISCLSVGAEISNEIKSAIASTERAERETVRDQFRKPGEVLSLLGIKPGMNIFDASAGGGYYTDILSRVVGSDGHVYSHNTPFVINRFSNFLNNPKQGWLPRLQSKQWQSNVTKVVGELDTVAFPLQLDAVMMVLFYHDIVWQGVNRKMMNRHIFNALKPGGKFLIIDHSGLPGSKLDGVKSLHRIDKQSVINELLSVGFTLSEDSNLLSHSEDTRDYPFFRDSKTRRDRTDRMVLIFEKPAG